LLANQSDCKRFCKRLPVDNGCGPVAVAQQCDLPRHFKNAGRGATSFCDAPSTFRPPLRRAFCRFSWNASRRISVYRSRISLVPRSTVLTHVDVRARGNVLAAIAFLAGVAAEELANVPRNAAREAAAGGRPRRRPRVALALAGSPRWSPHGRLCATTRIPSSHIGRRTMPSRSR
jgi:hypothetical protein